MFYQARRSGLVQIPYACFELKVTVTEYNLSMVEVYIYCSLKSSLLTISGCLTCSLFWYLYITNSLQITKFCHL